VDGQLLLLLLLLLLATCMLPEYWTTTMTYEFSFEDAMAGVDSPTLRLWRPEH